MVTELKRSKEFWDFEYLDIGEGTKDAKMTHSDYQHK